jgi:6-pyruvoyltetrahydropterin/6-carboxytetrahydropterin synthase
MYTIVKKVAFCYGHRLMDYAGKCAHPHGHNALAEIEISKAQLDEVGMVVDFGEVARVVIDFIEGEIDHQMLLRCDDPLVDALERVGEKPYVMAENPTAENIARLIFHRVREKGLPVRAVRLWETPQAFAEYREPGQ